MKHYLIKLKTLLQYNKVYYFLIIICFLYSLIYILNYKVSHIYDISDCSFTLRIKDYSIKEDRLKLEFDNLVGYYYFDNENEIDSFIDNYSLGDYIKVYGQLNIPDNNTIFNTFNYKEYLNNKNIEYILNINSFNKIKSNNNIFFELKNIVYKRIYNINNEYLYAFILGNTSNIDSNIYDNYKRMGVLHLFAISSLHVSYFSYIITKLLNKLKINRYLTFIIVFLLILFYAFIVNFTPSMLRALLFYFLVNINKLIKLNLPRIKLLLLTIIILLFINPNFIFNSGFLLSIIVSLFIEICCKKTLLNLSIISFVSSLPIIINMYYEINLLSFINNIILIPLVSSFIFPLSLICLIIPRLSLILVFLTRILEFFSIISSKLLNITIYFQKLNIIEILAYYIILFFCVRKKNKLYLLLLSIMIFIYFKPLFDTNKYVYFLDVKQGDSTLLVGENNILIDTGGIANSKQNRMISSIIPFFKSIGIKHIDYLIITHGDYDHMGEAINLVNNFKVEKVIFNCGEYNDLEKELIKVLDKKKIKYYSCIKELNIDNNKLYFLQTKEYDNENDNSNVIYTELNGYVFMFMGDASVTTEKEILDKYNLPDIDVLKIGHHGSKTSSSKEFINEINPKYSIISVGRNNIYHHPNKEVLENLKGSKIYRTDQDGSIMFKIKNNKLKIEICVP